MNDRVGKESKGVHVFQRVPSPSSTPLLDSHTRVQFSSTTVSCIHLIVRTLFRRTTTLTSHTSFTPPGSGPGQQRNRAGEIVTRVPRLKGTAEGGGSQDQGGRSGEGTHAQDRGEEERQERGTADVRGSGQGGCGGQAPMFYTVLGGKHSSESRWECQQRQADLLASGCQGIGCCKKDIACFLSLFSRPGSLCLPVAQTGWQL